MKYLRIALISALIAVSHESDDAYRLYEDIFFHSGYNKIVRPVVKNSETLVVKVRLKLTQILAIREKDQIMTSNVWLHQQWYDSKLTWDPDSYNGITYMYVPPDEIWLPDIVLYNNADGEYVVNAQTKATIYYNGTVTWEPPAIYKSMCEMNIKWFPFDEQICRLKFGSWAFDSTKIDLVHWADPTQSHPTDIRLEEDVDSKIWYVADAIDLNGFYPSIEWDIMAVPAEIRSAVYPCCPVAYRDITYFIHLRRKTLFYTVNLIIPSVGISFLTVVVFYLPADSSEKIALVISIFVSLNVYFLVLVEIIPASSLVIPMIARYLLFTLATVTASIVTTVISLELTCRSPYTHQMSPWVAKWFLNVIPKFLGMESRRLKEMRRTSDFYTRTGTPVTLKEKFRVLQQMNITSATFTLPSKLIVTPNHSRGDDNMGKILKDLCANVGYIAATVKQEELENEITEDWKYVAVVIDRILLLCFLLIVIIGSLVIICAAPSLFDARQPLKG